MPELGLIFLKFADNNYARAEQAINTEFAKLSGTRRAKSIDEIAIEKCGFYLPPHARYDFFLQLPEQEDVANRVFLFEYEAVLSTSQSSESCCFIKGLPKILDVPNFVL